MSGAKIPAAPWLIAVFFFYSAISSFFLSLTMLLHSGPGMSPGAAVAFFACSRAGPRLAGAFGHRALLSGVMVFTSGLVLSIVVGSAVPKKLPLLVLSLVLNGARQDRQGCRGTSLS